MRKFTLLLVLALLVGLPLLLAAQDADSEDAFCPGAPAPRLTVGETARVTPGLSNNVRAQPSLDSTRVGRIPGEELFAVTDGPVCAEGYVWWEVEYGSLRGWTAEGTTAEYWVEPAPGGVVSATESAAPLDAAPAFPGGESYVSPLGFAFSYPPGWTAEETATGVVLTRGSLVLTIGVRPADRELRLVEPITVGTLETIDGVNFVGQSIRVAGLRDRGTIKAVYYTTFDDNQEIAVDGLIFAIRLIDTNPVYDQISFLPDVIDEANQVVETFALGAVPAAALPPAPVEATAEPDATEAADLLPEVIAETPEAAN
jgi:hypothetical protein